MMWAAVAAVAAFTPPQPAAIGARRLILIGDGADRAAAAAHVRRFFGDEVRFVASAPDSIDAACAVRDACASLVVGGLTISRSDGLRDVEEGEDAEEALERALLMRDFALRGTKPSQASVVCTGMALARLILERAGCADDDLDAAEKLLGGSCSISVLDYEDGTWPAAVEDGLPTVHCVCTPPIGYLGT